MCFWKTWTTKLDWILADFRGEIWWALCLKCHRCHLKFCGSPNLSLKIFHYEQLIHQLDTFKIPEFLWNKQDSIPKNSRLVALLLSHHWHLACDHINSTTTINTILSLVIYGIWNTLLPSLVIFWAETRNIKQTIVSCFGKCWTCSLEYTMTGSNLTNADFSIEIQTQ